MELSAIDLQEYLRDQLQHFKYLPKEINRSLKLVKRLDEELDDKVKQKKNLEFEYLKTDQKTKSAFDQLQHCQYECLRIQGQKFAIVNQLLEQVKYMNRKLDRDLTNFQGKIMEEEKLKNEKLFGPERTQAKNPKKITLKFDNLNPTTMDLNKRCICNGAVQNNSLIKCDNVFCSVEWFHFKCVGIITEPKGEWLCPECLNKRDQGMHIFT